MQKTQQKEFSIPLDLVIDVSNVLTDCELNNRITGVNENRSLVHVTVFYQEGLNYHTKALENIQNMLSDYRHYRFEEDEEADWRN